MNRKGSAQFILLITILGLVIIGAGIWYLLQKSTTASLQSSYNPAPTAVQTTPTTSLPSINWLAYDNTRYRYSFSYPSAYTLGSDIGGDPAQSEVVYLAPLNADPIFICAADNKNHWSSAQILNGWINNVPSDFGKCMARDAGGTPPYVQSTNFSTTIAGLSAYEVTNITSNKYEAICDYLATSKIILGICLPPDDRTWNQDLITYRKILSSLQID